MKISHAVYLNFIIFIKSDFGFESLHYQNKIITNIIPSYNTFDKIIVWENLKNRPITVEYQRNVESSSIHILHVNQYSFLKCVLNHPTMPRNGSLWLIKRLAVFVIACIEMAFCSFYGSIDRHQAQCIYKTFSVPFI